MRSNPAMKGDALASARCASFGAPNRERYAA